MSIQNHDTKQGLNIISDTESSSIPISGTSSVPLSGSEKHWKRPTTIKDFVAQINQVTTMILNKQIDLDQANIYCRLTRNFAQLITAETVKARFLKTQPDLDLSGDVFEDSD